MENPADPWFLLDYAESLEEEERHDEAIRACEQALEMDPNFAEALFLLGELVRKSDRNRAIQSYRRALEINPDHQQAHSSLGRELIASPSSLEDGIPCLQKALAMDGEDGWAALYLANAYWRKGAMEAAETMYLRSLEIFPDFKKVKTWFADFLASQGRHAEAAKYRSGD